MFVFKPTNKTYTDPASAIFKPGIPFGRAYSKGDVCLLHEELNASKIILNSNVLKQAMLDSKEFFKEYLGLEISEVVKEEPKEEKTEEAPVEVFEETTIDAKKPAPKKSGRASASKKN